jgi:hypothetical protein
VGLSKGPSGKVRVFPYDTLKGKPSDAIRSELRQITEATRMTVDRGCDWLLGQITPAGPILNERNMTYLYKPIWAFGATGRADVLIRLLDWCQENVLQPNGDLFFPEEPGQVRDGNRLYRAVTIMRNAHSVGHALAENSAVRERLHQYQDPTTGAVYPYIGEDPARPAFPDRCNVLECTFFGEYAIAAGNREGATAAGRWLLHLIEQNEDFMSERGLFYWNASQDGTLDTEVGPGQEYNKVLPNRPARQANYPGWVMGCCIAFLSDLYDALITRWSTPDVQASSYLDAARKLASYEAVMPLETYHFPSKCKVAWGAGRLLSVLLAHRPDDQDAIDNAYRIGKRTYLYTFLGTRLASGGWGPEYYPLSSEAPELAYDYRTLEGLSAVPVDEGAEKSGTSIMLSAAEITGENTAELQYFAIGVKDLFESFARGDIEDATTFH